MIDANGIVVLLPLQRVAARVLVHPLSPQTRLNDDERRQRTDENRVHEYLKNTHRTLLAGVLYVGNTVSDRSRTGPASFESMPRLIPLPMAAEKLAPTKPPIAACGVNACWKIVANTPGTSAMCHTSTRSTRHRYTTIMSAPAPLRSWQSV